MREYKQRICDTLTLANTGPSFLYIDNSVKLHTHALIILLFQQVQVVAGIGLLIAVRFHIPLQLCSLTDILLISIPRVQCIGNTFHLLICCRFPATQYLNF